MNPIGQAFPVINMHLVVTSITSITVLPVGSYDMRNLFAGLLTRWMDDLQNGTFFPRELTARCSTRAITLATRIDREETNTKHHYLVQFI